MQALSLGEQPGETFPSLGTYSKSPNLCSQHFFLCPPKGLKNILGLLPPGPGAMPCLDLMEKTRIAIHEEARQYMTIKEYHIQINEGHSHNLVSFIVLALCFNDALKACPFAAISTLAFQKSQPI